MRLHFFQRRSGSFLRDSGFVQQKVPVDRWQHQFFQRASFFKTQCVSRVRRRPTIGKSCPDIKTGYYCYLQGSHLIFYTLNKDSINIIGVSHKSMDIISYFTPKPSN